MNKYLLGITIFALSCEKYQVRFFFEVPSVQKDSEVEAIKSFIPLKKHKKEKTVASLAEFSENYLPSSIEKYLKHVKEKKFRYSSDNLSRCATLPGAVLEVRKKGQCDEFALNAIYHLREAREISQLKLLQYSGYTADYFRSCEGDYTNRMGHIAVAYKTKGKVWRILSNGKDMHFAEDTLEKAVVRSIRQFEKEGFSVADCVAAGLEDIPPVIVAGTKAVDVSKVWDYIERHSEVIY